MTDETAVDLEAIRARADAATEGPWQFGDDRDGEGPTIIQQGNRYDALFSGYLREGDAEFIAHARTDIPALLDLVAALREQVAGQGAQLAAIKALAGRAEKSEEITSRPSGDFVHGFDDGKSAVAEKIREILAAAPSAALQQEREKAWDEGANEITDWTLDAISRPSAQPVDSPQNPYRTTKPEGATS